MKCAVIGGGIGGLAASFLLSQSGHEVFLWEATPSLGGVATSISVPGGIIEGTYHHIFTSDDPIRTLIKDTHLDKYLEWHVSPMGFFDGSKIYPFGTPLELLRYKPLSFLDRMRFGLSALYFQRLKRWEKLEDISVREWIEKYCSRTLYEKIWHPLLSLKFGHENVDKISAAWLWGRIHPRSKSREKGKEKLGYMLGSFQRLFNGLGKRISDNGGKILLKESVRMLKRNKKTYSIYTSNGIEEGFEKVLITIPPPRLSQIVVGMPESFVSSMKSLEYRGCICLIIAHKKQLSDIYWLNISSPDIKFGGVIEHTNFISSECYEGHRLTYIFNYIPQGHRYFEMDSQQLLYEYWNGLKKIFPALKKNEIYFVRKFQVRWATPLYSGRYSERKPSMETPWPGVYMANMTQIYPEDRNMSNSAMMAMQVARRILSEC